MILSSVVLSALLMFGGGPKPPATNAPLRVSGVVMQSKLVKQEPPKYPQSARKKNVQGTVTLDVIIGADGTVKSVRVTDGDKDLAKAAVDAVKHWRYEPMVDNGTPIPVETSVAVQFNLTAPPATAPPAQAPPKAPAQQ